MSQVPDFLLPTARPQRGFWYSPSLSPASGMQLCCTDITLKNLRVRTADVQRLPCWSLNCLCTLRWLLASHAACVITDSASCSLGERFVRLSANGYELSIIPWSCFMKCGLVLLTYTYSRSLCDAVCEGLLSAHCLSKWTHKWW